MGRQEFTDAEVARAATKLFGGTPYFGKLVWCEQEGIARRALEAGMPVPKPKEWEGVRCIIARDHGFDPGRHDPDLYGHLTDKIFALFNVTEKGQGDE